MSLLLNGDCLEHMKSLDDDSIDLVFCDLPYGQTSCKWDCLIDLDEFWKQIMRIKKTNTPIFFTCTTKFGVSLINSAPKKLKFFDLVWIKSSPSGHLLAKKFPMRKHEMIYGFYEKLPFYDLSSHKHKFIKEVANEDYDKREKKTRNTIKKEENYGKGYLDKKVNYRKYDAKLGGKGAESNIYDPPLPTTIIKEPEPEPEPVIKEEKTQISKPQDKDLYGDMKGGTIGNVHGTNYEPPLPTTIIKEDIIEPVIKEEKQIKNGAINENYEGLYGAVKTPDYVINNIERNKLRRKYKKEGQSESSYEPPLPTTMLEIKSTRGKHSTEKPVALMSWILKYYSKEGDVVLDPTMGSGSTGVACKNMKRNFIGIEKDAEIYEVAVNRIED